MTLDMCTHVSTGQRVQAAAAVDATLGGNQDSSPARSHVAPTSPGHEIPVDRKRIGRPCEAGSHTFQHFGIKGRLRIDQPSTGPLYSTPLSQHCAAIVDQSGLANPGMVGDRKLTGPILPREVLCDANNEDLAMHAIGNYDDQVSVVHA